jgi:NADPH:quinone reductase-like Zn-dependent oxidoreductase
MCRPAVGRGARPALTAWEALVDHAAAQPGQRLMVHGGAGGVGAFVTRLAGALGAGGTCTVHAAPTWNMQSPEAPSA